MTESLTLPTRLREILSEKDWRDPTKSGKAMERLEKLHMEYQQHGEFNRNHLNAIERAYQKRDLTVVDRNKPWAPLLWYSQFYSWYYEANPRNTQGRLFIGEISINNRVVEIWACVSSKLQFFTGAGPASERISLNKVTRLEMEWYWPLNELFDFEDMPLADLNALSSPAIRDDNQDLTDDNADWYKRQNNYIKALIFLLEAFPGLIMKKAPAISESGEIPKDVQVYNEYPLFPFLDDRVDETRPDLSTYLLLSEIMPEYDFMTAVMSSAGSSSASKTAPNIAQDQEETQQHNQGSGASNTANRPRKATLKAIPLKRPPITIKISIPPSGTNKRELEIPAVKTTAKRFKHDEILSKPFEPYDPSLFTHGNTQGNDAPGPSLRFQWFDPSNPSKIVRYKDVNKDGQTVIINRQVWMFGDGAELWNKGFLPYDKVWEK